MTEILHITLHDMRKYGRGKIAYVWLGEHKDVKNYENLDENQVIKYIFKYSKLGYDWKIKM
jgi:hypothetical protein